MLPQTTIAKQAQYGKTLKRANNYGALSLFIICNGTKTIMKTLFFNSDVLALVQIFKTNRHQVGISLTTKTSFSWSRVSLNQFYMFLTGGGFSMWLIMKI